MKGIQEDVPAQLHRDKATGFLDKYRIELSKTSDQEDRSSWKTKEDESWLEDFMVSVLSAMTESEPKAQTFSKDVVCLKRAVSAILDTKHENILDEAEAKALIKFVIIRFIEKRFSRTLHTVLPSSGKWFVSKSYKSIK